MKSMCLLAGLLWSGYAFAQSATENCPDLPPGTDLGWEVVEGPDFVFCKAIRASDGTQAFAVMLGSESPFRPTRGLREEDAEIDGHDVRWYRGEVATRQNVLVRETLVELGRRNTAHIVVRADSEDLLAENRRLAEGMRFRGVGGD
ncbi:hypothetical protein FZO89_03810 [Luteimonas viscosa]|uniref:Uncharacterized protein n=1 Tax=Luteimonas viscosa TaxID=1132694 RepID=A0A5D4XLB9_9GAMM|nr:hypothetical protein [Luteimonas viscosa]TYT25456.1 hypothetical protein FZO89_03810 [Luteimonas viscosa]